MFVGVYKNRGIKKNEEITRNYMSNSILKTKKQVKGLHYRQSLTSALVGGEYRMRDFSTSIIWYSPHENYGLFAVYI